MRKVYTTHGNPFVTHHKASTDRSVPFGRSEGPDGYVTSSGSPFVDVWGEEGGVFVANDTDLGSIIYETTAGFEEANKHISEVMGRSWKSSDDTLAVSWEVDAKTLYVAGTGYDVSAQIAGDIFACAMQDEATAVIVHRLDADDYAITTLALSNGQNGSFVRSSFAIKITDPLLFVGFGGTAGSFFTVTTPDTGSVISRWRYDVPVWVSEVLHTLAPLQCDTSMSYSKALDNGLTGTLLNGITTGSWDFTHVFGANVQTDSVALQGERIIAVSTDGDAVALLVQRYDGDYLRSTDKPAYATTEGVMIFANPVFALGWMVGWSYTYSIYYTAYDSGKLLDSETITSQSAFDRVVVSYTRDGILVNRETAAIPSGSYSTTTSSYTRIASPRFDIAEVGMPIVPPYGEIWDSRATYQESGATYDRTFTNAIKLYCADPAAGVYLYQKFNGTSHQTWLQYDSTGFAAPDPDDITAVGSNYSGAIDTVLNAGGVEYVLHTRPYVEEIGTAFSSRYDLNWEPTMPYCTQYQGPYRNKNVDAHGDYTNEEHKTINKSVNLAFKGRYIDSDQFKTLASWSYKTDAEGDISATLNFREFEDTNKLKYNLTWTEDYQPKAWQLIKGWGEFTRRAGFKTVDADGAVFVSPDVVQYPFKTLPVSLRMTQ